MSIREITSSDRFSWRSAPIKSRIKYLNSTYIQHESAMQVLRFIERELIITEARNMAVGLLVISPSGGGKSSLIKHLLKLYPNQVTETMTLRPVVHFRIPKSPTPKSLGYALLHALGDPLPSKGNAEEKFERIKALLIATEVKIVAIDDFQDVPARRGVRGIEAVGDWIRDLCEVDFPGLVIAFGTEAATVVRDSNPQLLRRMQARIDMPLFTAESRGEAMRFRKLIQKIDAMLPMAEESGLADQEILSRLFAATSGNFDYLIKLIEHAMIRALENGREHIEREDLRQGFDDQHQIVATYGNPFSEDYDGGQLNRPGQVFFRAADEDDMTVGPTKSQRKPH